MFKKAPYFFIVLLFSCGSQPEIVDGEAEFLIENPVEEIFVVAGHAYGNPDREGGGIHPPFIDKMYELMDSLDMEGEALDALFLTGDVLKEPSAEGWGFVVEQLDSLGVDWFISPGNHDLDGGFNVYVQEVNYFSRKPNDDLFLVMNTSNPGWTIDEVQHDFFKERLTRLDSGANLFVFTHQLWWQRNMPDYVELDSVRPNSYALYEGESDFWETVFVPSFKDLPNNVYYFAGDLGSDAKLESYAEDHWENHHFYASGMGNRPNDNFLLVKTYEDGAVEIQRIDF